MMFFLRNRSQVTAQAPAPPRVASLAHQWLFDEGSGQVAADSIGSLDGQLGNTTGSDTADPSWIAGGGISTTSDDYVVCGDTGIASGDAFTIGVIAKTTTPLEDFNVVVSTRNQTGGNVDVLIGFDGTRAASPDVRDRVWLFDGGDFEMLNSAVDPADYQLVFLSYDGSGTYTLRAVDSSGAVAYSATEAGTAKAVDNLHIGARPAGVQQYHNGDIHWAAVYSAELTDAQIADEHTWVETNILTPRSLTLGLT